MLDKYYQTASMGYYHNYFFTRCAIIYNIFFIIVNDFFNLNSLKNKKKTFLPFSFFEAINNKIKNQM